MIETCVEQRHPVAVAEWEVVVVVLYHLRASRVAATAHFYLCVVTALADQLRVGGLVAEQPLGLFARIEILPRAKSDVIIIPRDAIRREDGRASVLAVRDGRAVATAVQLGLIAEDDIEVLHGVRVVDEGVVGEFARSIAPGMRIRATEPTTPEPAS